MANRSENAQASLEGLRKIGEGWHLSVAAAISKGEHKTLSMDRRDYARAAGGYQLDDPTQAVLDLYGKVSKEAIKEILGIDHATVRNILIREGRIEGELSPKGALTEEERQQLPSGEPRDSVAETSGEPRDSIEATAEELEDDVDLPEPRKVKTIDENYEMVLLGLRKADKALTDSVRVARDVKWSRKRQDQLLERTRRTRAMLEVLEVAITGAREIDWEAELAMLGEE